MRQIEERGRVTIVKALCDEQPIVDEGAGEVDLQDKIVQAEKLVFDVAQQRESRDMIAIRKAVDSWADRIERLREHLAIDRWLVSGGSLVCSAHPRRNRVCRTLPGPGPVRL